MRRTTQPQLPPVVSTERARPQALGLPKADEFWSLLASFNKVALARRFPGWSGQPTG